VDVLPREVPEVEAVSQIDQDMAAALGQVVRRFTRRCWWADEDDVRQVAWVAAHKVRTKFNPELSRTGNIKPLVRLATSRIVQRLVLSDSAPVSASDHRRHELRGLTRASVEVLDARGFAAREDPEGALAAEQWRSRVVARLRRLVGSERAEAILEACDNARQPTKDAREALTIIRDDEELRRLWHDR
jgi:hypothetical protein